MQTPHVLAEISRSQEGSQRLVGSSIEFRGGSQIYSKKLEEHLRCGITIGKVHSGVQIQNLSVTMKKAC